MESKHQEEMLALRRKIELEMLVDKECVVCFDSIRCMALAPCGHIALCQPCAEALMLQTVKLCPTCRDPVDSVLRVY
jgi:pyrimidine deaminase RibD-like protein